MNTFDIQNLPKEAIFSLLLQIEPEEIKTVCFSKNPKVREICNSLYFRQAHQNKYRKVDLSKRRDLTEEDFKGLVEAYSVNLSFTNVTNEDLKYLSRVHTIDLSNTNITDEALKHLVNLTTLDCGRNTNIPAEGVKHLVNLTSCTRPRAFQLEDIFRYHHDYHRRRY